MTDLAEHVLTMDAWFTPDSRQSCLPTALTARTTPTITVRTNCARLLAGTKVVVTSVMGDGAVKFISETIDTGDLDQLTAHA